MSRAAATVTLSSSPPTERSMTDAVGLSGRKKRGKRKCELRLKRRCGPRGPLAMALEESGWSGEKKARDIEREIRERRETRDKRDKGEREREKRETRVLTLRGSSGSPWGRSGPWPRQSPRGASWGWPLLLLCREESGRGGGRGEEEKMKQGGKVPPGLSCKRRREAGESVCTCVCTCVCV